jgi:hypothetical protein
MNSKPKKRHRAASEPPHPQRLLKLVNVGGRTRVRRFVRQRLPALIEVADW